MLQSDEGMNHQSEIMNGFCTLRTMLHDRELKGWLEDFERLSGEDIVALAGNNTVFHVDLPHIRHRIVFDLATRFKLVDVKKSIEAPVDTIDVVILVVRELPTTTARRSIDELKRDIQIFALRELQRNITMHELVPTHKPIRAELDIQRILSLYQLQSRYLMPLIMSNDPVARYFALKPGQLVYITRPSESCGEYSSYRCCLKA